MTVGAVRILFFGTYNAHTHPRVAVLREGLDALGNDVEECNVAVGVPTSERVRMVRHPWYAIVFFSRMLRVWVDLWRRTRRLGSFDAIVVGYLGIFDVHLARLLWPDTTIVLDHLAPSGETAKDRGASSPIQRALAWADLAALRASDVVCVDTSAHLAEVAAQAKGAAQTVVVPVGAPAAWFSPPRDLPPEPLRVIFFGLYTPLQGAPVIGTAIRLLADAEAPVEFTMVGRGQDHLETMRRAGGADNVRWIDWIPHMQLPELTSQHHVCLGVFGEGEKARKVVPNKVYQGSAAGCAIVTSGTQPQRDVLHEAAWYVQPGNPKELADVLTNLSDDPALLEALRWKAFDLAKRNFRATEVARPLHEQLEHELGSRQQLDR